MLALVLRGFMQRKLRVLLTGDRDRARRRADGGHLHPHRHDQPLLRGRSSRPPTRATTSSSRPTETLGRETRSQTSPITEAMLAQVRATPGVAEAAGAIFTPATFLDVHGKRLTNGGAPAFVALGGAHALRVLQAGQGPLPGRRRARSRSTRRPPNARGLKLGQQMIVAGLRRRPGATRSSGIVQVRRRRVLRRRRRRDADARRGAAGGRRAGPLRPDRRRRRSRASRPSSCARASARRCPAPSTCARARSRPPRTPPTSKATSASCAPSCWSSPTSRSSSARSSSSTPSRSPSPSARASSACCARSAPRARRSCGRSSIEGLLLGRGRRGARAARRHRAGAGAQRAVQGVRRRPARQRHGARDAHDRRLAARGHRS